jgi:hypothetical protein
MSAAFKGQAEGGTGPGCDLVEARKALQVLVDPAHSVELRAIPTGKSRVFSGSDLDGMVDCLDELSGGAQSVCYLLNPCSLPAGSRRAARVGDIVKRRWIFLDFDPVRPADTSSTDLEKALTSGRSLQVRDWLNSMGWPDPLTIDSGNGYHLLYRIDLPADPESQKLLKTVLGVLSSKWNNEDVELDSAVHNASRVAKIPGTWARKGLPTRERPHRISRLIGSPDDLRTVSRDQLEKLARMASLGIVHEGDAGKEVRTAKKDHNPPRKGGSPFSSHAVDDEAAAYVQAAVEGESSRVATAQPGERNCVLNRAAFSLGQLVGGGELSRQEAVSRLEEQGRSIGLPDEEIARTIASGLEAGTKSPRKVPKEQPSISQQDSRAAQAAQQAGSRLLTSITLQDLMGMDLPEPKWAVQGILSEGLSILAGKPKLGKSFLALNLGITIAAGGLALGQAQVTQGHVLYLSLEDRFQRLQSRARKVLSGLQTEASQFLHLAVESPRMGQGGLQAVEQWIQSLDDQPRLVIVDVWAKFRPFASRGNTASAYDQDYQAAGELKSLADRHGISVLALHHCKKQAADDVVDEISGTLGLAGAADGLTILTRARNDCEATLFVTGRDVQDESLALEFDPVTCCWSSHGSSEHRTRSKVRQSLLDILKRSSSGYFASELAELVQKPHETVRKELWRMNQDGLVRKLGSKYLCHPDDAVSM